MAEESDAMNQSVHSMPQEKLINVLLTVVENVAMQMIVKHLLPAVTTNV